MVRPIIPSELVEEILSRAPAASARRLRYTCKRWNSLFKEPGFRERHFRLAPKQPRVFMLKEFRIFPVSVDLNVVPPSLKFEDALTLKDPDSNKDEQVGIARVFPPSLMFKDELTLKVPACNKDEQVGIAEVFHCDGLLLCVTKDDRLFVWNPCSGETRWIPRKTGYKDQFAFGYEKKQSCRSYKILRFTRSGVLEIYELSSNLWRVVNAPNYNTTAYCGVTLKGNTYWISVDEDEDDYLICFDFTSERFRRLPLPPSLNRRCYMALSVVREEQLSVLSYNNTGLAEVEMWVTKNIDAEAELSYWSKSFSVSLNSLRRNGLNVFTSLLIDEEKKVALCCSSCCGMRRKVVYTIGEDDDEYYTEIRYKKDPLSDFLWPFIFTYVPSLVQIQ